MRRLTPLPRVSRDPAALKAIIARKAANHQNCEDRAKVLAYFADGEGMTAYLQACAEKAVRAGVTVPGTRVVERQVAA